MNTEANDFYTRHDLKTVESCNAAIEEMNATLQAAASWLRGVQWWQVRKQWRIVKRIQAMDQRLMFLAALRHKLRSEVYMPGQAIRVGEAGA